MTVRLIVMGVAGSGKSTVGKVVAAHLALPFVEGDSLHAPESVEKMSRGTPLTDDDRWPWLDRVAKVLHDAESGVVISCSALKRAYRDRLRAGAGGPLAFLFLDGSANMLSLRVASRKGHFMKQSMVDSQLATLESPAGEPLVFVVAADDHVDSIANRTAAWIGRLSGPDEASPLLAAGIREL